MITSMFLACHPALYSHLMHSRVTVCRFAFEFLKHFWFHAQAKQQIEETLLRNRKMVQALCIDTSTFTYVAWSCCFWRKVPTEPQQEGQRFTLQDGHLATPRIQDWKSWQLQSLHMVTWYIANHNKGFQTMTTPSSFDISRAGPGSGEFYLWVIYLLSGIGRGSEAQLDPDKPEFGFLQHGWCWGSGLVFGEDGEDPEESIMKEGGAAVGIQTELVEGEMVNWVKGRLHRGLVLRCAMSMMQIWVNLSLFFSFHLRPHDMWVWAEVWEECGRRPWGFLYLNFT